MENYLNLKRRPHEFLNGGNCPILDELASIKNCLGYFCPEPGISIRPGYECKYKERKMRLA